MPISGLDLFRQTFSRMTTATKILLVVMNILFFLFFGTIISVLLARPLFGYSLAETLEAINYPTHQNLPLIKFFQIVQSVFVFIIPAMLTGWLFGNDIHSYAGLNIKPSAFSIMLVLFTLVVSIPFMNATTFFNSTMDLPSSFNALEEKMKNLEESASHLTQLFLDSKTLQTLIVNLLMIAILPAVGEEMIFRGIFQRLFREWTKNSHLGILIAAFIFSFFHFQFYGFLPRFILGIFFGYLLQWSGSLWLPIAGHFINNGLAVFYYHFSPQTMGESFLDTMGTGREGRLLLAASILMSLFLLLVIYRFEKGRKTVRH